MFSEHAQHAVWPSTSAPPPRKLHALVELTTKMHEVAVAVDAAAAAAVDAAAAADRPVSGNGEVHRSSLSKDRCTRTPFRSKLS